MQNGNGPLPAPRLQPEQIKLAGYVFEQMLRASARDDGKAAWDAVAQLERLGVKIRTQEAAAAEPRIPPIARLGTKP